MLLVSPHINTNRHGYTYVLSLLNVPLIFQSIPPIRFVTEYQIFLGQELTDRRFAFVPALPLRRSPLWPRSSSLPSVTLSELRRRICTLVKALLFFFHPVSVLLAPKHQQKKITEGGEEIKIQPGRVPTCSQPCQQFRVARIQVANFPKSQGKDINQPDFSYWHFYSHP